MIVVIQCAASKRADAGHLITLEGKRVVFVAHPELARSDNNSVVARPDDISDTAKSWRDVLQAYNNSPGNNPLGLLPAYQLYENKTYSRLVYRFGVGKVFILSAGWGLIRADFLTPYYDITFSQNARGADDYKRRPARGRIPGFVHAASRGTDEEIVFFGGKD